MRDYRVYCLDGRGKIAAAGEWIEAKNDDEAVAIVRAKKLALNSEIWTGNRLVGKVPAAH